MKAAITTPLRFAVGLAVCSWSAMAADNPCSPAWTIDPAAPYVPGPWVGIYDAAAPVKLCYSPAGVNVQISAVLPNPPADPGKVSFYDANACPEPGDPPELWYTPNVTYSWELPNPPAGTTPIEGNGATVEFTTTTAAEIEVRFFVEGTIPAGRLRPAWYDAKMARGWVYISPKIESIGGTGPDLNHFTFTYDADQPWPNGQCEIPPHASAYSDNPSSVVLSWSIPDKYGCTKVILTDPPESDENPRLYYGGLPWANASLGDTVLTVTQQPGGCSDPRTVQLFFPVADDAVNHPGTGSGTTPNWIWYWRQTGAYYSPYEPTYIAGLGQPGWTWYVNGAWRTYIGPEARTTFKPLDGPHTNSTFNGIDLYAYTWRHEARHANVLNVWFPFGPDNPNNPYSDEDNDDLPDVLEECFTAEDGGPYETDNTNTHSSLSGNDGHRYVYFSQTPWTIGSVDSDDWSDPGHQ